MNQTRYQRRTYEHLPKMKHPHQIWGADDLSGRRWKCWVCGFVADSERDKIGDGAGFFSTDSVDPGIYQGGTGDKRDVTLSVDDNHTIYLAQIGPEGNPLPTKGNFKQ